LGDEVGWLNDYAYRNDPAKTGDSRWVHRPSIDETKLARRHDPATVEGRIFAQICRLIKLRKTQPGFAGNHMAVINVGTDHVFAYLRTHGEQRVVVLANFTERDQRISANELRLYGLSYQFEELISGQLLQLNSGELLLSPYQVMWLTV